MTDREALEELLRRFGLTPAVDKIYQDQAEENDVVLTAKLGGVEGYLGFFAAFQFDDDGKFKRLDIAE